MSWSAWFAWLGVIALAAVTLDVWFTNTRTVPVTQESKETCKQKCKFGIPVYQGKKPAPNGSPTTADKARTFFVYSHAKYVLAFLDSPNEDTMYYKFEDEGTQSGDFDIEGFCFRFLENHKESNGFSRSARDSQPRPLGASTKNA